MKRILVLFKGLLLSFQSEQICLGTAEVLQSYSLKNNPERVKILKTFF